MKTFIGLLFFILFFAFGCTVPAKIVMKEDTKEKINQLSVVTSYKKIELGIAFIKPFILRIYSTYAIYSLSVLKEDGRQLWEIRSPQGKNAGYVKYGKLTQMLEQLFPLNNSAPENLIINSKYKLVLQTQSGKYEKEFLYQPSEIYILGADKK